MNASLHPESARRAVNEYITELFNMRRHDAGRINERYELFWDHVSEVALAGGKRIRPYLTLIGYGALDDAVMPVAAAQELIHIAMLMHDDVIDKDDTRHGVENMIGGYRQEYNDYLHGHLLDHYASSAAVLAGDVLISEAYRAISISPFSDACKRRVSEQMHASIYETVGGQLLDVEAAFVTDIEFDPLQIYRYKTASYSFIGPLVAGGYCAGLDDDKLEDLRHFASNLGIAFQIQDDLLGIFGDEMETGKSTVTDLREGKQTVLVLEHRARMDREMSARFTAFGNSRASTDELERIKHDMRESGAQQRTMEAAAYYFDIARKQLSNIAPGVRRDALQAIVDDLQKRRC